MAQELCRLCLSKQELKPLFPDMTQSEKYSEELALTTGMNIHANDGLPQQICKDCFEIVNKSLELRRISRMSEIELLKLGFQRIELKVSQECKDDNFDFFDDISENNLKEFKIEVELDRISQDDEDKRELKQDNTVKVNSKKNEKEMRDVYLNLVDGELAPYGSIKCKLCKKSFSKWDTFVNHAEKHLEPEKNVKMDPVPVTRDGEGSSNIPTKKKKSRKEMHDLYKSLVEGDFVVDGPVKCKVCKKTLQKWNSFINHARKHLGFKFICEFCGKSFGSSNQLKRHCMSFHGMERDLKCKLCDYLALDAQQLKVHERRVHTGERPYVCDVCAAAYFSRKCLLQHIESHRTIASVQCEKCNTWFKSRRHLAKHMYGTHSDKRRERRRERREVAKQAT